MSKARPVFARSQSAPKASGIIQAEIVRTKGSAVQWFPLIGLWIGITSSTLAFWSAEGHDASGALAWQAMYVTGMAAPLLALLAGLAEDREKRTDTEEQIFVRCPHMLFVRHVLVFSL